MSATLNETKSPLVSTDWLRSRLDEPHIRVLDATFFLPQQGRNAESEFLAQHIPNAGFFDIDRIADRDSTLPHMLPTPEQFADCAGKLGIGNDSHVVVYDNHSFLASARCWWTFRVFGHDRVSVLDGGLKRWQSLGLATEHGLKPVAPRNFDASYRPSLVLNLEEILASLNAGNLQIVDARSQGRFAGTEAEPRAGLRSGHIPKSFNLPFTEVIDPSSFCLKPDEQLRELFQNLGVSLERPVGASCGSGVTASILALALYCIGKQDAAVYDGSWSEWGARSDVPVATAGSKF